MSIRFCLVGAGRAGLVHAVNIKKRIKNADLSALCDADAATLARVGDELGVAARFTDFREACASDQVDAVIVVTPTFLHAPIALEAARRGKHIFLEKPMAITVAECQAIGREAAWAGVRLQIGFMRRFDEGFLRAREILASGAMGRPMIVKSTGRGPGLPPPWIYDIEKSNGVLAEVNSHDFDSIRWLVGADIVRVHAEAANFKCPDAREDWPDFYDNAVVMLRFADGTLGTVDGTCPCHYGYDARVEILCEKGLLMIGHIEQSGVTEVSVDGQVKGQTVKSWRTLFREAYLAELEHFIECVEQGREPRVGALDGLRAVEAVVAANRSIRERRPIDIERSEAL